MSLRRSSVVCGVSGLVLVALATVLQFVLVPLATRLPANTDVTVHFAGTATLLNAEALKTGDLAHVFHHDVPVTLDRRVHVTSTHGNTAVVADEQTLHAGAAAMPSTHVYAVNRSTLNAATAPAGVKVEPAEGITIGFPVDPKPGNSYRLYDPTTQLTGELVYQGTASRGGRSVYTYSTTITGAVKDKTLAATLPSALPKPVLTSLTPALPADVKAQLAPVAPHLPAIVPLGYESTTTATAYVDQSTGIVVDQAVTEQVTPTLSVDGTHARLVPVMATAMKATPASVQFAADKAASAGKLLMIVKTAAPIGLYTLGLALIIVAIVRRRKAASTQAAAPGAVEALVHA